ncbi:methylated-DNA--[protein]-cysteine S-methyltransferase [Croceibacter atlanticus]|uniref:methylated-DNA--[protein]-cysteine S-methyltransferase n=1 Tax=Croceibacter atlanticus TaxID=313588 RepID=UPI001C5FF4A7|nr:methylated-DNA--[protein]-cysteine S-methyltransferase [Croceibacter atlanticus]MBW4969963.1 methylated-DNA--[protein]-cysteine S-methyltransferase [Croceibacter atlanticus]
MDPLKLNKLDEAIISSPLGAIQVLGDENGVQSILFLEDAKPFTEDIPKSLSIAVQELTDYFTKKTKDFTFKLNPQGTEFQQKVWQQLCTIPFSKTSSYLDMAKALGDPKVIRAAASANGKNPISIVIPCHRVIGSDGSMTGYTGGIWRKEWLLNHESAVTQGTLF